MEMFTKVECLIQVVHQVVMPVYDEKYIKAKVREFDDVIKTNFLGNKMPKEKKTLYINSVMRMDNGSYR